jgi:uncharacterized damage-inducible protein DinB
MITAQYARCMADYNRWQNASIYGAAGQLSDEQRRETRGAFFGSIHATLNHLLWADQIWMSRFAGTPVPKARNIKESIAQYEDWSELTSARVAFDQTIIDWTRGLDDAALAGDLTWFSGAAGREVTRPRWLLVTHMFNHQTHHRGQVHCLLTQNGVKPGDTDLPLGPAPAP